eukprot:TRINITY_DN3902_c0_g2_i7.p1 TRINITY_DN3902_c0_g2~~TRINITY_DN3902_c0_g2_i7.p1  ORF type:complete len:349 (-),score=57.04 TRINITY_DN3902_c0_g2_i7:38-1084(-)
MCIRDRPWNKQANVLYIESPAGVGFSIAKTQQQKIYDDNIVAQDSLVGLLQWYKKFSQFRKNRLFITGESYGGMYVPYFSNEILKWNSQHQSAEEQINLQGILVVNGLTDLNIEFGTGIQDFYYMRALYGPELREEYENACLNNIQSADCEGYLQKIQGMTQGLNVYDLYRKCFNKKTNNPNSFILRLSGILRLTPPCVEDTGIIDFLNDPDIKAAMHVNADIKWEMCEEFINEKFQINSTGSYWIYPKLIKNNIQILIMTGDTDGAVPSLGTLRWVEKLQQEYNLYTKKPWQKFYLEDKPPQVAGYITEIEGLTLVTVKGAGHMVPQWKRESAFNLYNNFIHGRPAA